MSTGYSITASSHTSGNLTYEVRTDADRVAHTCYSRADAEQWITEREAYEARFVALKAAYDKAGYELGQTSRRQGRRVVRRFVIRNRQTGEVSGDWATLAEVPEPETAEVVEAPETEAAVEAEAVRGTITEAQADTILRLIAQGVHEEGGFFSGPTTEQGVYAMDRDDAETYIDSLTGRY